jgi:predicted metalloendopeptidase
MTKSSAKSAKATKGSINLNQQVGDLDFDAWYKAFDVKPSDKLYLPEEKRITIW